MTEPWSYDGCFLRYEQSDEYEAVDCDDLVVLARRLNEQEATIENLRAQLEEAAQAAWGDVDLDQAMRERGKQA